MPNLHDTGDEGLDNLLAAARQGAAPDELLKMDAVLGEEREQIGPRVRALMQTIHILGHKTLDTPEALEVRERVVRSVRRSTLHTPPADEAARPIALAQGLVR